MKKLLILGQLPKEYGGSYTTGVANVIMELSFYLKEDFDTYIYGTNLNTSKNEQINGITTLGYSYNTLLILMVKEFLRTPLKMIKMYLEFKNHFGIRPIKNLLYYVVIKNNIRRIKPDVINAHGIMFAPVLKNIEEAKNAFYSFHGFMYDDKNSILANKKRGVDIEKLYFNSAKYVKKAIYLTEEMKYKGEEGLKLSPRKSVIIPNGVNIDKFKYCKESRKSIRNSLGINNDEKIIISVGALTNRKNHIGFINFLIRNNFKGHYWIIGKFEAQETKNKILEYQKNVIGFNIKVNNYVPHDELYKYYSVADIYAHPSTSEGQALVVFEALCCGVPLIINEDIEGTVCVGDKYSKNVHYVNLNESLMPDLIDFDRDLLSTMCKNDFNWSIVTNQYKDFLNANN